jgi:hypothetical protein
MTEFSNFISAQGLMDLPLAGRSFTWSNNLSWSRLDRFLVSPDWGVKYPGLFQTRVPRFYSNRFPVLLVRGDIHSGKRPFKFENMWLQEDGLVDRVRLWWASYSFQGSPSFVLTKKLKALKIDLKSWNDQVFGNVDCLDDLRSLDRLEEERGLASEEILRKSLIASDLERIILQEELGWRQKSRVLWLKEGDKCTKFFHRIAYSNKRSNSIESLLVNGFVTSDQPAIRDHIVHFYESLFSEQYNWRPWLDGLAFNSLSSEEAAQLELPFEENEVLEVVKAMNRDKAPGLDGFPMAFFQDCWDVIKYDISCGSLLISMLIANL